MPRPQLKDGRGSPRDAEWIGGAERTSAPRFRADLGEPEYNQFAHQGFYARTGAGRESAEYLSRAALGGSIAGRSVNPEELYAC